MAMLEGRDPGEKSGKIYRAVLDKIIAIMLGNLDNDI
jgi:hypothetical protein